MARLGGDEFAILRASEDLNPQSLVGFGATMLARLHEPFEIDRHVLKIGASIGVATAADGTVAPDTVLSRADLALYRAKSDGRNRVVAFDKEMEVAITSRRELAADLDAALDAGALDVHYQPIVDADTRATLAMEALARWHHPQLGDIAPAVFIPLARRPDRSNGSASWSSIAPALMRVRWPSEVSVAVNVSAIQVAQGDLPGAGSPAPREDGPCRDPARDRDYRIRPARG